MLTDIFSQNNFDIKLLKKYKSIFIVGTFNSSNLNRNFDEKIFFEFIKLLKQENVQNISIYEKKFKDTLEDTSFTNKIKELDISFLQIECTNLKKYKGENFGYFLDEDWLKSELKIILTKASVHRHHALVYPFSVLSELGLFISISDFDWRKIKQKEAIQILRAELDYFAESFISDFPKQNFLGITDSKETLITNEHLFFLKSKKIGDILIDYDLAKSKEKILKLLN
jgi:hypothetical protein